MVIYCRNSMQIAEDRALDALAEALKQIAYWHSPKAYGVWAFRQKKIKAWREIKNHVEELILEGKVCPEEIPKIARMEIAAISM